MIATADGFHRLALTPDELAAVLPRDWIGQRRFVAWRPEQRKGKWTKVPVNAHTGKPASSTDPSTWATLAEALDYHVRNEESRGIGIMFAEGGGEVGIDLDDCIDEDGRVAPWALEILQRFPTYAEVSPSGCGVKLFAKALPLPHGTRKADFPVKGSAVEMYSSGRYFTLTGNKVEGAPSEMRDCSAAVEALYASLNPADAPKPAPNVNGAADLSDDALIEKAKSARNGAKFQALWEGHFNGGSQSESDLALCGMIAFYAGNDPARIDRLFRRSGLMREKWERQDYRDGTIRKALDGKPEFCGAGARQASSDGKVWVGGQSPVSCAPFVPFPTQALPPEIAAFVGIVAKSLDANESLIALPILGVCAGAVGNTREVEIKPGWTEPSILWCLPIAPSGTGKTPALRIALRPLHLDEEKYMAKYREDATKYEAEKLDCEKALTIWKRTKGGTKPGKPVEPTPIRRVIEDVTVEGVTRLLEANPRGLTVGRDELSGWIGGFDKYNAKGGADLPLWLQMHGGQSLRVDRAGNPPRYVARAGLSIVGGIQPGAFERAFDAGLFDAGLPARLILAMPPARPQRWTDDGISVGAQVSYQGIIDRLLTLQPQVQDEREFTPVVVKLADEAKSMLKDYINQRADADDDMSDREAAAWSKLRGGAARLALIVHLLRWAESGLGDSEIGPIDADSMRSGITLARWAWNEARRVYSVLEEGAGNRNRRKLMEALRRIGRDVTANDLQRLYKPVKGNGTAAETALDDLVRATFGEWRESQPGSSGPHTRYFHLFDTPVSESPNLPIPSESSSTSPRLGDSETGRQEPVQREVS